MGWDDKYSDAKILATAKATAKAADARNSAGTGKDAGASKGGK